MTDNNKTGRNNSIEREEYNDKRRKPLIGGRDTLMGREEKKIADRIEKGRKKLTSGNRIIGRRDGCSGGRKG